MRASLAESANGRTWISPPFRCNLMVPPRRSMSPRFKRTTSLSLAPVRRKVVRRALSLVFLKGLGFVSTARRSRPHSSCDRAFTSPTLILGRGMSAAGLSLSRPARWEYLKKDLMAASARARAGGPLGLYGRYQQARPGNPGYSRGKHLPAGTCFPISKLGKRGIYRGHVDRTLW